jgi:hypothetical protein
VKTVANFERGHPFIDLETLFGHANDQLLDLSPRRSRAAAAGTVTLIGDLQTKGPWP